ncbi:Fic/DOC family protein [Halarcobacter ebronensis]|uniref:protein adenylyltransferase n=1 Tax=Halarcobacter ebronensis TaxID=1462615 RepID=A0A4Q1AJR0_9BACT|nr:Fic family protein [Halarcobacter ebronensis]QKF81752.1 Fic domain-containing protein [Halarcobacter ebronensis]RXK04571.1 cell filamentation protein Fic [Halarcobacter ebronensis]
MASKYQLKDNSFYYEGTDIPKNKFDIRNSELIHEIEKELIEDAYNIFYEELTEKTLFDENYFISLHKRTFESLYEWAGAYRDFNMAKGESRFCQGSFVESSSKKIFEELKNDNYLKDYENKSKQEFAKKIAYYKCEINALHPFYELNGRITRMFFDMIVAYNGYRFIDYSTVTPKQYIDCAIECVQYADESGFEKIIFNGLNKLNL